MDNRERDFSWTFMDIFGHLAPAARPK